MKFTTGSQHFKRGRGRTTTAWGWADVSFDVVPGCKKLRPKVACQAHLRRKVIGAGSNRCRYEAVGLVLAKLCEMVVGW